VAETDFSTRQHITLTFAGLVSIPRAGGHLFHNQDVIVA
jgi:hypothetical protein